MSELLTVFSTSSPPATLTSCKRQINKSIHQTFFFFQVFFQSGVCPVCLETKGERLSCCQANIHTICLEEWIWLGNSIKCPCCKQKLTPTHIQSLLVGRFKRVPGMKAELIQVRPLWKFSIEVNSF